MAHIYWAGAGDRRRRLALIAPWEWCRKKSRKKSDTYVRGGKASECGDE